MPSSSSTQGSEDSALNEAFECIFSEIMPLALAGKITIPKLARSFFDYGVDWGKRNATKALIYDMKSLLEKHTSKPEEEKDTTPASEPSQAAPPSAESQEAPMTESCDNSVCASCGLVCEKVVLGAKTSEGTKLPHCSVRCALTNEDARQCEWCSTIIHWRGTIPFLFSFVRYTLFFVQT